MSDLESDELETALSTLTDKGLLYETNSLGFRCHQILQEVSREHLSPNADNCKSLIKAFGENLSTWLDFANYRQMADESPRYFLALNSIVEQLSGSDLEFAPIYENLGILARVIGQFDVALQWHARNVEIRSGYLKENPIAYATALRYYAEVQTVVGNYTLAQALLERELQCLLDHAPGANREVATAHEQLGIVLQQTGELAKAIENLDKAVELYETVEDIDPLQKAMTNNTLGMTLINVGRADAAVSILEDAQHYLESEPGGFNSLPLATTYLFLSNAYIALDLLSKARYYLDKAKEEYAKSLPEDDFLFSVIFNNASVITLNNVTSEERSSTDQPADRGYLLETLEAQERAIEILEQHRAKGHPDFAAYYFNLARIYDRLGQKEQAKKWHQESLNILGKEESTGLMLALFYFNTVTEFDELYQRRELIDYLHKAVAAIPRQEEYVFNLAGFHLRLAHEYMQEEQFEQALTHTDESYKLYRQVFEEDHLIHAFCLQWRSICHRARKDYEDALKAQLDAVDLCQSLLEETDPDFALLYSQLARIYKDLHNYERALFFRQKAMSYHHPDLDLTELTNVGQLVLTKWKKSGKIRYVHYILPPEMSMDQLTLDAFEDVGIYMLKDYDSLEEAVKNDKTYARIYGESVNDF